MLSVFSRSGSEPVCKDEEVCESVCIEGVLYGSGGEVV